MSAPNFPDGVSRYAADEHDLDTYAQAENDLAKMRVPLLRQTDDPNSKLFVAYFDGTGNDAGNPHKGVTNVAHLYRATAGVAADDTSLGTFYLRGPGTQENDAVAAWDGARGSSYDARLETMYYEFCSKAGQWLRENPDSRISLANVGFSRGAEQAAGFARMVAERGIEDVSKAEVVRNSEGLIVKARYPAPPLQPPGQVAQAELLFDPVGTGIPYQRDRRPPPQVLTGLQITAEDERRDLFLGTHILDPGFTHDGRFLNVTVGGCHSDIGGSSREDGLARRSYNLGVDFLNALSDRPFLHKQHLRPDLDVVHRSVEHSRGYDDDLYRANERRGLPEHLRRGHVEAIGGRPADRSAQARDAEPIDRELDAAFPRRRVEIGPVPETPSQFRERAPARERNDLQPEAPAPDFLRRLLKPFADADTDPQTRRAALQAYLDSPQGQAFAAEVEARSQAAREAEAAQRAQPVALAEQHAPRVRALAM